MPAILTDKPLLQIGKLCFVGPFVRNQLRQVETRGAADRDATDARSAHCAKY
jgi:hypothetical protein